MKLTLKNIGVLKHAELDLSKDLIILCGPNNTGKTYAAYTVYAVNRYATKGEKFIDFIGKEIEIDLGDDWDIGDAYIDIWETFLKNEKSFSFYFPDQVSKSLSNVFGSVADLFGSSELSINFDHEQLKDVFWLTPFQSQIKYGGFSVNFYKKVNDSRLKIAVIFEGTIEELGYKNFSESPGFIFLTTTIIPNVISTLIFQIIFKDPYIAPAERIAINIFSKQLSVRNNPLFEDRFSMNTSGTTLTTTTTTTRNPGGILSRGDSRFPLPIRDCLEISERLIEYQKVKSEFGNLADIFESEILGGKVSVSEYGEVQYRPDNSDIKPLGIHLSASMVKSLSSLVFYFRHIAYKGDFIIIDEPELNLHPDNQRKVARILARIVNAGFKVMISTHSDYIYRELNNQIMLNQDSDMAREIAGRFEYNKEELLDHKKVGAYLFLDGEAKMLPVSESGFEIKTIDAQIGVLNEISMEIFSNLF